MKAREGQKPCEAGVRLRYMEQSMYNLEQHKALIPKVCHLPINIKHIDGYTNCLNPRISGLEKITERFSTPELSQPQYYGHLGSSIFWLRGLSCAL